MVTLDREDVALTVSIVGVILQAIGLVKDWKRKPKGRHKG